MNEDERGDGAPSGASGGRATLRGLVARLVPRGRFGRSVAVLVGGTTASQAIFALTSPLLTRVYAPDDFGVLGVYSATVTLLGVVVGLRYMYAIPLPGDEAEAVNVVTLSLALGAAMSLVFGVVGIGLGDLFTEAMGVPELAPYMWLLPVSLLGNLLYQTLYIWAIRERGFGVMARTRVTQALARVGVQLSFGVAGVSPLGLLLGDVAGGAVGSGSFARMLRKRRPQARRLVSAAAMKRSCRRYSRFAWFGTPAALLNTAGLQGIPLLVAYSYGGTVAGWYALTMRVVALPISVLGMAVGETYFGIGPELARTDPAALRALFKKAAVRLFAVGVGPTVILVAAGPALFSFVFGDDWAASGVYATYMAPALLAQLVTSPLSSTTTILERQDLQLIADGFRVALVLSAFLLADRLSWSANAAVMALSAALLISYIVYFLMSWWLIRGMDASAGPRGQGPPAGGGTDR